MSKKNSSQNNQSSQSGQTGQSSEETSLQLGRHLRVLREQKGLSIHDVADRLKLPARQIETLENGQYSGLPEPVFIRGFLRSYGRFLDMDENQLNQYLNLIAPPDSDFHSKNKNKKNKKGKSAGSSNYVNTRVKKSFPTWIFGVLGVGLIIAAVIAWQSKSNSENDKQQDSLSSMTNPDNPNSNLNNLNTDNVITKPMTSSDTATETATLSPNQTNQQGQLVPTQSASAPKIQGVAGELVITTKNRTMLTVTDVNGNVLISKIVPAASEHRFKEGAPFEVRMGYGLGSTATFNGQEIDLNSKKSGGKSVAFTAGELPNP